MKEVNHGWIESHGLENTLKVYEDQGKIMLKGLWRIPNRT